MTTDRLVNLAGENGDAPKEDYLNIGHHVFSMPLFQAAQKKLKYRRLEESRIIFIFFVVLNKNSFIYFEPSYGKLFFLTLKINICKIPALLGMS